ncbi:MAG: hypothetical protein H7Z13_10660 [Ferruginibacter sp.]|nr:hypothetical protein [Ferruginibacter sp.]
MEDKMAKISMGLPAEKDNSTIQFTLLITACIQPPVENLKAVFRSDAQIRLNDYITALRFWLGYREEKITNIIFIENSGYDLKELKQIAGNENKFNRTIEFIQFIASPIPTGLHYGYAELEILDTAFTLSKTIGQTDFFIKVTGRLYFPTLSKLLKKVSIKNRILIDFKDFKFFNIQKHYAVTTLIIIRNDFYRDILFGAKTKMEPVNGNHFETCYYNILKPLSGNKDIITRFPFNVNPVGYGAHLDVNYGSFNKRFANVVRKILRIVYPKFKI